MGLFDKLFGKKPKSDNGYIQEYYTPKPEACGSDIYEQLPDQGHMPIQTRQSQSANRAAESDEQKKSRGPGYRLTPDAPEATPELSAFEKESAAPEIPRDEYLQGFRTSFRQYFPTSLDTIECHMQLPYMVSSALDITPVIEYAKNSVYSRFETEPEKLSELSRAAVAKVAMNLEQYIGQTETEYFSTKIKRAHTESLEKAWIVLDFYCRMLKSEYTTNIGILYVMISDELITRATTPGGIAKSESYEDVLAKCASASSQNGTADEVTALKKRLFEKLMNLESIYLIHDEVFNNNFPYIGADGRLELQTDAERAASLARFIEKNGDSKVSVREYRKEEYEKLLATLLHNGLTVVRLDNGLTPVEIDIDELYDNGEKNLIEVCNRYARRMFISELQYGYRLKKLLDGKKDSEEYKVLSAAMVKARTDGYRALAGGLVYVFNKGGAKPGVTLYTPTALETAAEIMKAQGVVDTDTLRASSDSGYEAYNGEISLRSIRRQGANTDMGFVCAFTDRENAEKIHSRFAQAGVTDDAILVMTLGELCRNCKESAGFVLDMSSYGLEVPVELFSKMVEIIKSEGIITNSKKI